MVKKLMTLGCSNRQANASIDHCLFVFHLSFILGVLLANLMVFGIQWTFQFATCAPHLNHHDYPHLTMAMQLLYLESIRCLGFEFRKKSFEPLFSIHSNNHTLFFKNLLNLTHHVTLSHNFITSMVLCTLYFYG
jgi:predicted membrane protein